VQSSGPNEVSKDAKEGAERLTAPLNAYMILEAVLVIGAVCVILGGLLLIPGLWWARRKAKNDSAFGKRVRFTPFGWIFLFVMLVILLGGLMTQYLAPESLIGNLTVSRMGRLVWAGIVIGFFVVLAKLFASFGILIERRDEGEKTFNNHSDPTG